MSGLTLMRLDKITKKLNNILKDKCTMYSDNRNVKPL